LYQSRILESLPQVLSHLDREPFSPTYGSFDRFHWAWSATDVSNSDFQRLTVPLAFIYTRSAPDNRHYRAASFREWVEAAVLFTCREQAPNGSFTQWYPNDNSIVSAGFVIHDLLFVAEMLEGKLAKDVVERLLECAARAGRFLVRYQERHGFNSNHQLGIAAALLDIHAYTGDTVLRDRARSVLHRVLSRQMQSGAFYEYAGADPGYQTLGLAYLTSCLERLPSEELARALDAGLNFALHFLSPISGPGGFGSRGTRLLFPSAFEIAARRGGYKGAPLVVRRIITHDRCVTNRNTDIHNLGPILTDYVRAFVHSNDSGLPSRSEPIEPPDFFCPQSSLFSFSRGTCRIRGRLNGAMLQLEHPNSGNVIFASAGYMITTRHGRAFTGTLAGTWQRDGEIMGVRGHAQRPNRVRQSPASFFVLRLFQLAVGRFMLPNLLLKRALAWLLIFRKQRVPVVLERTIEFGKQTVVVSDVIHNRLRETVRIRHCTTGYISFMGSARYWDEALPPNASSRVRTRVSLGGAAQDDVQGVTEWDVEPGGKAEITYTISVD